MQRRGVLLKSAVTLSWPFLAAPSAAVEGALRSGAGSVLVFRHALAPGTFDPPGFKSLSVNKAPPRRGPLAPRPFG